MAANPTIIAENLTMGYRMDMNRITSLKEWFITNVQGRRKIETFYAVRDISLTVPRGEILGIIGHNGAGKSTLLKLLSGIIKPTSGRVQIFGRIAPMLELGSGFDVELSGRENILLNGAILGYSETFLKQMYDEIVAYSELGGFIHMPLKTYSSGMVARLAFAVATVVSPDILIVDEILSVGDESFQRKSHQRMMELMNGGATVLFVSHDIDQIRFMSHRVLWIDHGQTKMIGDPMEVCNAYLHSI